MEYTAWTAYVSSYTLFLILRSCRKHRILAEIDTPEVDLVPKEETIIAIDGVLAGYINAFFPLCVGSILYTLNIPYTYESVFVNLIFDASNVLIIPNFIFMTIRMFFHEKEGPQCWQKISPTFFKYGTIFFYLVIPLIFLVWISAAIVMPFFKAWSNIYFSWIMLY